MDEQLERNKKTVTGFYDLMFNQCKPREAIQRIQTDRGGEFFADIVQRRLM